MFTAPRLLTKPDRRAPTVRAAAERAEGRFVARMRDTYPTLCRRSQAASGAA
jgi:hypothetical protein